MKIKIYIIFLLNIWMKLKGNLFYKFQHKNKIRNFGNTKLKAQPKTQLSKYLFVCEINCFVLLLNRVLCSFQKL